VRRKPPVDSPVTRRQQLEADWKKLMMKHAAPLERGAQAKGVILDVTAPPPPAPYRRTNEHVPSLPMFGNATSPVVDPLQGAKHTLKSRVGVAFNKGGLQYLTDGDLAEQKTGAHRRRT